MSDTALSSGKVIGQLLIKEGLVTREQVIEALELQKAEGGKTFEILIRLGHLDKDGLHGLLSKQPGVASIDLDRFKIDPELIGTIPEDLALSQLVLPIDKLGKLLTVAMACPLDTATIKELEGITGLRVKAMLCKYDDIVTAVGKYYKDRADRSGGMHTFTLPPSAGSAPSQSDMGDELTEKIRAIDSLVLSASVLEEVQAGLRKDDLRSATQSIGKDPGLTATVLAYANSGAYGLRGEVDSIGMAVAMIGAGGLNEALQAMGQKAPAPKLELDAIYAPCERAGLIAATLAKKTGKAERAAAYTGGLVRRLGWAVFCTVKPTEFGRLNGTVTEAARLSEERSALGMSHLDAGGRVAVRWRFPDSLCHAAGAALDDEESKEPIAAIASVAALLAESGAAHGTGALEGAEKQLQVLGLSADAAIKEAGKLLA